MVEVLRDEAWDGGREERWVPVEVDGDGVGVGFKGVFGERGGFRGLGMERDRGGIQDVGGVARVWGFGGRRV